MNHRHDCAGPESLYPHNRNRHPARRISIRIPHAGRISPRALMHAAMALAIWGFAGFFMPMQAEAANFVPATGSPFASGTLARSVTSGDFNGDGNADIAASATRVGILLGDGAGSFATVKTFSEAALPHPESVTSADFDGDIPAVLNASMAVRANARHVSGAGAASVTTYHIPTDTSFIIAGRVGANTGAFVEFSGGKNSENGTATSNIQLLNSFDIGNVKFGVGWASTSFGGSGVMEVSNVFGQHANKLGGGNLSAINAAGFASNSGNAIGGGLFNTSAVAAWIGNDLGCIQFALLAPADATGGNTAIGVRSGYLVRGVAMLDIAGWDALAGFGSVSGNAGTGTAGSLRVPMRLLFFDAQVQGIRVI